MQMQMQMQMQMRTSFYCLFPSACGSIALLISVIPIRGFEVEARKTSGSRADDRVGQCGPSQGPDIPSRRLRSRLVTVFFTSHTRLASKQPLAAQFEGLGAFSF